MPHLYREKHTGKVFAYEPTTGNWVETGPVRRWPLAVATGALGLLLGAGAASVGEEPGGPTTAVSATSSTASPSQTGSKAAVASTTSASSVREAAPLMVDAARFAAEFDANQVAAERKYKDRRVQFQAKVGNITDGRVSFTDLGKDFSLTQISCSMGDPDAVLRLRNGQAATVSGYVDGQSLGVISLRDCVLVKA